MLNPRDMIPVGEDYLRELGRATYNFAYLEWGIVWLTETIEPGFLKKASKLTAGEIAKCFSKSLVRVEGVEADKPRLSALASEFEYLVEERNRLIHGNPYTATGGEQRLLYLGKHGRKDWTSALIASFADRVALTAIEVGDLLHSGRYESYFNSSIKKERCL